MGGDTVLRDRRIRSTIAATIVLGLVFFVFRVINPMLAVLRPQPLADFSKLSEADWSQDVAYLARQLPRFHKNAFAKIDRSAFQAAVTALQDDLPSLDSEQIAVRIMQLVAMIGDAHTQAIAFSPGTARYPLAVEWFKDGLYVTRAAPGAEQALGSKVVGIGSMSTADAFSAVASIISHENDYWLREMSEQYLIDPQILRVLGIAPTSESAKYTFEDANGRCFELDLQSLEPGAAASWSDAPAVQPLYRQRRNENYWFKYLAESRTMYLKYNACVNGAAFAQLAQQLWDAVDRNQTDRLVIDLRGNDGGNSSIFRPILVGIVTRSSLNQRGKVFAITDRGTFSSGMLNAIELRGQTKALIYGEPTGGRPNSYGEVRAFYLPNSRIRITYSTKYFMTQAEDTPSVMPDVTVELSSADYFAGRDPVLEAILASGQK